jgi:hypothetical protein
VPGLRLVVLAVTTATIATLAPVHAAGRTRCAALNGARAQRTDVVWCAGTENGKVVLRRWTGTSWATATTGVAADGDAYLYVWPGVGGVAFAVDRAVYVRTAAGQVNRLFESTSAPHPSQVTTFVGALDNPTGTFSVAFASVATAGMLVYSSTGVPRPAVGGPKYTKRVVLAPDFRTSGNAFALAADVGGPLSETSVFGCRADLSCVERRATFGSDYPQDGDYLDPEGRTAFVEVFNGSRSRYWLSQDSGARWQPWHSLNRASDAFRGALVLGRVRGRPGRPAELWVRVRVGAPAARVPDEAWLRSVDSGTSWVVVGRGYVGRRGRSTVPTAPMSDAAVQDDFEVLPDGRLLVGTGPSPGYAECWTLRSGSLRHC